MQVRPEIGKSKGVKRVKTAWDFSKSVFGNYQVDSAELVKNCFEFDWKSSKIEKLVKNADQQDNIKQFLLTNFSLMKEAYKYYAALNPINN